MNDLISRKVAIDALDAIHYTDREDWWAVLSTVENLPSAQPEIIRCKDCIYRDAENGFCKGRGWPMQLVHDDGFCEKGKGRE